MSAVMNAPPTAMVPCKQCGRELYMPQLRKALRRCPDCQPPELPYDHDAMRRLARSERRRVKTIVAQQLLPVLAAVKAFPRCAPELATTDRVLIRWGAFGSGRPAENPDVYRESRPVPLDPDTQAVVSHCIGPDPRALQPYAGGVPLRVRAVTYDIWLRGAPESYVGEKHGMKPRTFGRYIEACLRLHRAAFLASHHRDLIDLIEAQP
jgi:hypothetical protein